MSNVCTFLLPSRPWPGLGATACVEGMLPPCFCLCNRSDKQRKDTKTSEFDVDKKASEFDVEKTQSRAISTVNGGLVADKLSFLSLEERTCEIADVTADAENLLFACN